MSNNVKTPVEKQNTFWVVLMIVTCLFPVTVPFVLLASAFEARIYRTDNKRLLYSGLGALTFALFMILSTALTTFLGETQDAMKIMAVIYGIDLALGIYLLALHCILMKRNARVQKCLKLIRLEHITSVKSLGEIMGADERQTRSLLKKIFRVKLIADASLSPDKDEIEFKKSIWAKQLVVCENCGARMTVNLGQALTCEYCDSPLKVKRIRETH